MDGQNRQLAPAAPQAQGQRTTPPPTGKPAEREQTTARAVVGGLTTR